MTLQTLQERIREAAARRTPLRLRGGGTKDFFGNPPQGEVLDTRSYAGVVSYEPTELVLTARCGTPLAQIEQLLAGEGQALAFEPPHFGAYATLGGCVACGLSGPRRSFAGALRDFVLGARVIDGRGAILGFGGQVMKNVAGYDVSRLMAGSLGTLGLIAEVSLKVLPLSPAERTLRLEMGEREALEAMNRWSGQPLPLSATAWVDGALFLRLSGAVPAVRGAHEKIGGEALPEAQASELWRSIREHAHAFFSGPGSLWRIAVPATCQPLGLGATLIEWAGGQRWVRAEQPTGAPREAATRSGGHATLFRAAPGEREAHGEAFAPLAAPLMRIHRELKAAFDPAGVLNRGRLYREL